MHELRPLDLSAEGIEELRALLNKAFPHALHFDSAYLDWMYNQNPEGAAFGTNAFDTEGRLVGHFATHPLRATAFGAEERGLLSFNTATDPDFRGKGLFSDLLRKTYRAAADAGYGYVIGVTNAMSTPVFVGKLDHQLVCPLEARIGIGPVPHPRPIDRPDFVRIWDRDTLAWRLGRPDRPYRISKNRAVGGVFAATGKWGVHCQIAEFPADLLPDLPRYRPSHPVKLWIGNDPTRSWSRSTYANIPIRFRESPLNLLFFDLREAGRKLDPTRVRYEVVDFDAY